MKRILFSPLYNYKNNSFSGDNVAHYHLGKYLWHICNIKKTLFQEPIYHAKIQEEVSLSFVFFPQQPQYNYFKKPQWIDEFLVAKTDDEINGLARNFDFFMNQYRYRGAQPPETNCGYTPDLKEINLHLPAIIYKAVFEENLYLDDLLLSDKYDEFIKKVRTEISPDGKPIIVLHNRGMDPWKRQQPFTIYNYGYLLNQLLKRFPDHHFVLVGENWGQTEQANVSRLDAHINENKCQQWLGEHNACLQYILSAYFCRDADVVLVGMSGFSLFLESIRPMNLVSPIPVFWMPEVFEQNGCNCIKFMQKTAGWHCPELEEYKSKNPDDAPYQFTAHHFLYYSRNQELLKSYCFDNPNTSRKILALIESLIKK